MPYYRYNARHFHLIVRDVGEGRIYASFRTHYAHVYRVYGLLARKCVVKICLKCAGVLRVFFLELQRCDLIMFARVQLGRNVYAW